MTSFLPNNASSFETAVEAAATIDPRVDYGVNAITGWKVVQRPSGLLPWLIYEYGLDALQPFVPNLYTLIEEGRQWSRLRGTHKAVYDGLGFIGYAGQIKDPATRRIAWADYQLILDRVRDLETDLPKIDGIVSLSDAARCRFRRGVYGYDIPATETGYTKTGSSILSDDSGAYVENSQAKWSFGRRYQFEHTFTQSELTELGVWIEEVPSSYWADIAALWDALDIFWSLPAQEARQREIVTSIVDMPCWLCLRDQAGDVIGYRRAVSQPVSPDVNGEYEINGIPLKVNRETPTDLVVVSRTGFGDGSGSIAASASLIFGATSAQPPGKLWLSSNEITGGVEVASSAVSIQLGQTVREKIIYRLVI